MRAMTPDALAQRWGLSGNTIRTMCKDGRLPHMRLGAKAIRIPLHIIEEYERCQTTASDSSKDNGLSPGTTQPASDDASAFLKRRKELARGAKPRTG